MNVYSNYLKIYNLFIIIFIKSNELIYFFYARDNNPINPPTNPPPRNPIKALTSWYKRIAPISIAPPVAIVFESSFISWGIKAGLSTFWLITVIDCKSKNTIISF